VNTESSFAKELRFGYENSVHRVGGVTCTVTGPPRTDDATEAQLFQDLVDKGSAPNGISLSMGNPALFGPVVAAAHAKKVPLIAVDNRPAPTWPVDLYIGDDNYLMGQMMADEAIRRLPPAASGDVVLGTPVPGVPVLDLRAKGMRDELKKRLPKVNVLGPFDTKPDPGVNLKAWETVVSANPDALAFLATADADAYNLAKIRKRIKAKWVAAGFDLDPQSLRAVKDGQIFLLSPEHYVKGAIAGRLQAEHAKNGAVLPKGWIYTPGLVVNQANIDEIIKRQQSNATREAWFAPQVDKILNDPKTYLRPLSEAR
jgi:ribose transport system substrate-binding protein